VRYGHSFKRYAEVSNDVHKLERDLAALKVAKQNPVRTLAREVLFETRPFGWSLKHNWIKGAKAADKAIVDAVNEWIPTAWWERSIERAAA
jgi:hypothetical protein